MIESNIRSVLTSQPEIVSIAATRIHPLVLPNEPTLPAITYSIIGASVKQGLTTSGLRRYRVEINCWGSTYADAVTLRSVVVDALDGYQDANISVLLLQPTDFFDHELLQYRAMVEFYIFSSL